MTDAAKVLSYGCYYEPQCEPESVKQWLNYVLERLKEAQTFRI